jgi:hypothetical protein
MPGFWCVERGLLASAFAVEDDLDGFEDEAEVVED